jgi:hypothetical protein
MEWCPPLEELWDKDILWRKKTCLPMHERGTRHWDGNANSNT